MAERKRPVLISIFAGWLIGCSVLGAVVFSVVFPQIETMQTDGSELSLWIVDRLGKYGILAVCLCVYLFTFFLGRGLWTLQPWSREAMLWGSSVCVASYVCWAMVALFHRSFGDVFGIILGAIIFSLPLFYFHRANIKKLFVSKATNQASIGLRQDLTS